MGCEETRERWTLAVRDDVSSLGWALLQGTEQAQCQPAGKRQFLRDHQVLVREQVREEHSGLRDSMGKGPVANRVGVEMVLR